MSWLKQLATGKISIVLKFLVSNDIDLAAGVVVTFWDGDVDEAICGIPGWLLDAVCCIAERDFVNDFAVCDGDEGEYGKIIIRACDYCQLVVRVIGHLVCAFRDAKRNRVDDGIVG
jgi:hypothetical protein